MRHRKKIISSIVVAIALTMWSTVTVSEERIGGIVGDVYLDQLATTSDLVIIGTYNSQKVEDTGSDIIPLRSVTNLNVLEVLKGNYTGSTIDVLDWASGVTYKNGYREEITVEMFLVEYIPGEKMILFLDDDRQNVAGTGYYVRGGAQGAFTINMDNATNSVFPDRSTTVQEIRNKIP